jgi:glycosyltransferase involved in cell wall biosynthesis
VTRRLRIALDGRRLQDEVLIGVGRYISNLLPYLADEADLTVLTDARFKAPATDAPVVPLRIPRRLPGLTWLELAVGPWLRSFNGVFWGPFNAVPLTRRHGAVVTLHDLSFEHHPEDFTGRTKRHLWRLYARHAVRHAEVVTVSEFIAQEIVRTYGVDRTRLAITPNALQPGFGPRQPEQIADLLHRFHLRKPYVLALGGAKRRGLSVAITAWQRARNSGSEVGLAVVGPEIPPPDPNLVYLGALSDEDLQAVMAGAEAFLYATRYEGYGMPAHEAAASGTPVVCARIGPLPEILGDAAAWCDDPTAELLGRALHELLSDPVRHAQLRTAALQRIATLPTWTDAATTLLDVFRRAADP